MGTGIILMVTVFGFDVEYSLNTNSLVIRRNDLRRQFRT